MLIFNDILLLARPKVENNWKLLAEFELGSLHVDDHRSSDIPEQEFAVTPLLLASADRCCIGCCVKIIFAIMNHLIGTASEAGAIL